MRLVRSLKDFFQKGDVVLLGLCLLASAAGLVLIYSATRYDEALQSNFLKQAMFIAMGVVAYVAVTFIDVEFLLEKWWKVFLLLGLLVILLIQPFGEAGDTGNKSWVYLPGIPFGFQPGEIAKLAFIVVLAWLLNHERANGVSRLSAIVKYLLLTCTYAGLLAVLSGDFGMVLVYLFLFVIMAWVGGVNKWWFIGVGGGVIAVVVFLWRFILPRTGLWTDYRILRFRVVLDHSLDPLGVGWHQSHSLLAIGSGQLTGMGYLNGKQTQSAFTQNLPARHTDFIFAVCGEEFGLIGCCALLALLLAIILRCVWVSRRAKSHMSAYIAMGFAGMLMVQTVLNVGMCLYVTPVIGLTLPFISYGGSSTLTLFVAMGIVSGIKMRPLPSWLKDRSQL
ncbi:MAG TPA: FtsW/RodA/SpoVE family cell cycle protein [Candidatus Enterenecus stercoripullorum]|nr:FtsW/RodA/SpoVE family cell cycle protein [Candidatus Enterenecus stercoripullorum]